MTRLVWVEFVDGDVHGSRDDVQMLARIIQMIPGASCHSYSQRDTTIASQAKLVAVVGMCSGFEDPSS